MFEGRAGKTRTYRFIIRDKTFPHGPKGIGFHFFYLSLRILTRQICNAELKINIADKHGLWCLKYNFFFLKGKLFLSDEG